MSTPTHGSTFSASMIRRKSSRRRPVINGTSEWQMRNQFRAWAKFMTLSM